MLRVPAAQKRGSPLVCYWQPLQEQARTGLYRSPIPHHSQHEEVALVTLKATGLALAQQ